MTLQSQQQENKDRFFQQFAGIQAVKNEISGNTYSPIGSFLDDLTASTWTAATQAERERVRALIHEYFLWAKKEGEENMERGNVMIGYDMDSRQVAARQIAERLDSALSSEDSKDAV